MRTYGIFKTTCPTGWTRETGWDNLFLRGGSSYGAAGGSSTHNHGGSVSLPSDTSTNTASRRIYQNTQDEFGMSWVHTHVANSISSSIASESSEPVHITVVFCYKEE